MVNGNSYLGFASRAEELNIGEKSQAELDVSARAGFATPETRNTLNCEVYSSFEGISSDHRNVTAKIRLSLHRNKKQSKPLITTGPHLPIEILAIN